MLTISIVNAVIFSVALIFTLLFYRGRIKQAEKHAEEMNRWVTETQRKDQNLKGQTVSDLFGGGDCTVVMQKLARDRVTLFGESPTEPTSAWTIDELRQHAKQSIKKSQTDAQNKIKHVVGVGTVCTLTLSLLVSYCLYSFISKVPQSTAGLGQSPFSAISQPMGSSGAGPLAQSGGQDSGSFMIPDADVSTP